MKESKSSWVGYDGNSLVLQETNRWWSKKHPTKVTSCCLIWTHDYPTQMPRPRYIPTPTLTPALNRESWVSSSTPISQGNIFVPFSSLSHQLLINFCDLHKPNDKQDKNHKREAFSAINYMQRGDNSCYQRKMQKNLGKLRRSCNKVACLTTFTSASITWSFVI